MQHRNLLWIALAALWLGGCGGDKSGPVPPPPGIVQVVAEAPLDAHWYGMNLLPNGHFTNWTHGQPTPADFEAPDPRYSQVGSAGGTVRQTWTQSDLVQQRDAQFRGRAALRAGVDYEFIALAETRGDGIASIGMWLTSGRDEPEMVEPTLLTLLPGQGMLKKYAAPFRVPENGTYEFTSHAVVTPEETLEVVWHRWHIVETTGDAR